MVVDGGMLGFGDPRSLLLAFYPGAALPPLSRRVARNPMVARINHGAWIASCACGAPGFPSPGCVVVLASPYGWCLRCSNAAARGRWRRIVVPPPDERARIEAVLACRPNVDDRNWEPDESIAELIRQNLEAGDPIPEAA